MRVEVTQEDIDQGKPRRVTLCPVARAVGRVATNRYKVTAFYLVPCRTSLPRVILPDKAMLFIDAFDAGQPVKPFTFAARGLR